MVVIQTLLADDIHVQTMLVDDKQYKGMVIPTIYYLVKPLPLSLSTIW